MEARGERRLRCSPKLRGSTRKILLPWRSPEMRDSGLHAVPMRKRCGSGRRLRVGLGAWLRAWGGRRGRRGRQAGCQRAIEELPMGGQEHVERLRVIINRGKV